MRPDRVPVTLAWFRPALTLVSLVAFLVFGTLAVKRFRGQRPESSEAGASGSELRQDPDRRERARVHVAITDSRHGRRGTLWWSGSRDRRDSSPARASRPRSGPPRRRSF